MRSFVGCHPFFDSSAFLFRKGTELRPNTSLAIMMIALHSEEVRQPLPRVLLLFVVNLDRKACEFDFLMMQEGYQRLLCQNHDRLWIIDAFRKQHGENEIILIWPCSLHAHSEQIEFTRFSCIRVDVSRVCFYIAPLLSQLRFNPRF